MSTLKAGAAKFVLGFTVASTIFSFMLPVELANGTRSALGERKVWRFALALFASGSKRDWSNLPQRIRAGRR